MLSNITKLIIKEDSIELSEHGETLVITCDVNKLFDEKSAPAVIDDGKTSCNVNLKYSIDYIVDSDNHRTILFCPYEMVHSIKKDHKRGRPFDLTYRKHLVYDYSRDHYNLVVPTEVAKDTLEIAKKLIREHSCGKKNKPTGIVLHDKLIVVKGDNNFSYSILPNLN